MASSILTNSSALATLRAMTATQNSLNTTQAQISSGLRIATASDNPAYWSIANRMNSDVGALGAVSTALSYGSSVVGTASSAVSATLNILTSIKADFAEAQQPGVTTAAVQADLAAQQQSLIAVLSSSSFNGVNLLDGSSNVGGVTQASFVSAFTRSPAGATAVQTLSVNTQASGTQVAGAGGILAVSIQGLSASAVGSTGTGASAGSYAQGSLLAVNLTNASSNDLKTLASAVDGLITQVTAAGTQLGTATSVITNQQTYESALSDAITSGVGSLVDTDMNAASTRLQALQTQQQLEIQILSVSNQNTQMILKLFGG